MPPTTRRTSRPSRFSRRPGVRELVEHGDPVTLIGESQADEVGADEAGSTTDEQSHARTSRRARWARSPSRQAGRTGASERVLASAEKAGRWAGRPRSAVVCGSTRQAIPASSNVAIARSNHVHEPAAGDVQDAGQAALGDVDQRGREVAGVGRAAGLVVDHGDLVALGADAAHRVDEVLAVRAEDPGGANDRAAGPPAVGHRLLAGELGAPVGALRAGRGGLGVRLARRAVEDVVAWRRGRAGRRPAAAARLPAPSPLTAVAAASCSSAPSTSVQAAQLTTASGRAASTAARTAAASVMSRSARARATTSWPASPAAVTTSRPSMPAAPVTRRRMAHMNSARAPGQPTRRARESSKRASGSSSRAPNSSRSCLSR